MVFNLFGDIGAEVDRHGRETRHGTHRGDGVDRVGDLFEALAVREDVVKENLVERAAAVTRNDAVREVHRTDIEAGAFDRLAPMRDPAVNDFKWTQV